MVDDFYTPTASTFSHPPTDSPAETPTDPVTEPPAENAPYNLTVRATILETGFGGFTGRLLGLPKVVELRDVPLDYTRANIVGLLEADLLGEQREQTSWRTPRTGVKGWVWDVLVWSDEEFSRLDGNVSLSMVGSQQEQGRCLIQGRLRKG